MEQSIPLTPNWSYWRYQIFVNMNFSFWKLITLKTFIGHSIDKVSDNSCKTLLPQKNIHISSDQLGTCSVSNYLIYFFVILLQICWLFCMPFGYFCNNFGSFNFQPMKVGNTEEKVIYSLRNVPDHRWWKSMLVNKHCETWSFVTFLSVSRFLSQLTRVESVLPTCGDFLPVSLKL